MRALTPFMILLLPATPLSAGEHEAASPKPSGHAISGAVFFQLGVPGVHGNGRSCATCHVPEDAFQLTPEHVESRFQALQRRRQFHPAADDPLFRLIDANDGAEDFTNLRKHALVRVFIELPVDAQGERLVWPLDDPEATIVAVWRATPTVLNTAFTAPYQLDGRMDTLEAQALGALVNHSEITRVPRPHFLGDLAAFQNTQFSSPSVKRLAKALAAGHPPPATDPPLSEFER
jgi:cytochrome c peroxidase